MQLTYVMNKMRNTKMKQHVGRYKDAIMLEYWSPELIDHLHYIAHVYDFKHMAVYSQNWHC